MHSRAVFADLIDVAADERAGLADSAEWREDTNNDTPTVPMQTATAIITVEITWRLVMG
jgi:hypothetical protein